MCVQTCTNNMNRNCTYNELFIKKKWYYTLTRATYNTHYIYEFINIYVYILFT